MRGRCVLCAALIAGSLLGAEYDSARAPYPYLHESYPGEAETLLGELQANAPGDGAFSAVVEFSFSTASKLDLDRNHWGPLSFKSSLAWKSRGAKDSWSGGAAYLSGRGADFVLESLSGGNPVEWWQKTGGTIYAEAFCDSWPVVWRFHHDALEADMLAYAEGLGLILWAFNPGEYLRRADHLEKGEEVQIGGKTYSTLIATPSWIAAPLHLQNRTHYPFNESTLRSWAEFRPRIIYYVDRERRVVAGADFIYFAVQRSGPKDWYAKAAESGLLVRCFADRLAQDPRGTWYPAEGWCRVLQGEKVLREGTFSFKLKDPPAELLFHTLPSDKRRCDPWPPYRSEVYLSWLQAGEVNHANRFGLAIALAYEGRVPEAEKALYDAIEALLADKENLLPETFGGLDWELGLALYELFWRYNDAQLDSFFEWMPKNDAWYDVLRRACYYYERWRRDEPERISALKAHLSFMYRLIRLPDEKLRRLALHEAYLREQAERARTEKLRNWYLKLADDIRSRLSQ